MKPGAGKRKGSSFERDICRYISNWLSNGQRDDLLWRSPNSGGKATVNKSSQYSGDICLAYPEFGAKEFMDLFSVECKAYKDLDLFKYDNPELSIWKWWYQAEEDAKRVGKVPILIFKINRQGTFVAVNGWEFVDYALKQKKINYFHSYNYPVSMVLSNSRRDCIIVMKIDEFFNEVLDKGQIIKE